jgi:hypothetical protein
MKLKSAIPSVALVVAVLLCTACSRQVTIPMWQRDVELYVRSEHAGDSVALRDVTLPDSRRGFAVIGDPSPHDATDVYGVLLGYRPVADHNWFIYLVGQVKQLEVADIRLAAVTFDGVKPMWRMTAADDPALQQYVHARNSAAATPFPPSSPFPLPEDRFRLDVNGSVIAAVHEASSATWTLDLATTSNASRTSAQASTAAR